MQVYPAQYFDWLFDSYLRNLMIFASVPKYFDLTPFDLEYAKGKTGLLHYRNITNDNNEKGQDKRNKNQY